MSKPDKWELPGRHIATLKVTKLGGNYFVTSPDLLGLNVMGSTLTQVLTRTADGISLLYHLNARAAIAKAEGGQDE